MTVEGGAVIDISLEADADLSAHKYKIVKLSSDGQAAKSAAATDAHIGIAQDDQADAAGKAVQVRIAGESKLTAGGTIAAGAYVTSDANGDGVSTTSASDIVVAQAMQSAVDNDVFRVMLVHFRY